MDYTNSPTLKKKRLIACRSLEDLNKNWIVLYKYMPLDALEKTIDSWTLKLSEAGKVNDALEYYSEEPAVSSFCKDVHLFLSFSTVPDNPKMWGLYADNAKGVCMVFVFPRNIIGQRIYPIEYSVERPKGNDYIKVMTTKGDCWAEEREYRMLLQNANDPTSASGSYCFYNIPMRYFAGVIRGWRCPVTRSYLLTRLSTTMSKHKMESLKNIDDMETLAYVSELLGNVYVTSCRPKEGGIYGFEDDFHNNWYNAIWEQIATNIQRYCPSACFSLDDCVEVEPTKTEHGEIVPMPYGRNELYKDEVLLLEKAEKLASKQFGKFSL